MRYKQYLLIFPALLLVACNKYDIQPEQAEGFIKFFSSTLTEQAYDVKETADGGYVMIGTTSDEEGLRDLYLVKTDKFGNEASWSPVIIGGVFDDVGASIQVEADGSDVPGFVVYDQNAEVVHLGTPCLVWSQCAVSTVAGQVKQKVLPRPSSLSTSISAL